MWWRADAVYTGIQRAIDRHIATRGIAAPEQAHYTPLWAPGPQAPSLDCLAAGIGSVIWATGFRADYAVIDAPDFDGRGLPIHTRGVTPVDGLSFVGLPRLHTWGSGRFSGIARDTEYLAERVVEMRAERSVGGGRCRWRVEASDRKHERSSAWKVGEGAQRCICSKGKIFIRF